METSDVTDIETELLLEAIFQRYKYDFRRYSRASIRRRLANAMVQLQLRTISELQESLLRDPDFFLCLLQFLTIPVTEMFRDPTYFRVLREKAIPYLRTYPSLKVWVAGCSTGEEAYSLAILFEEEGLLEKTIIYATDINPSSLKTAEAGAYGMADIQKYTFNYQRSGGTRSFSSYYVAGYQTVSMVSSLKKHILFTDHSLATDNVFSEVQFVSCRNVLIYFEKDLQNRAVGLFSESLSPGGFLGLGEKENLRFSQFRPEFEEVSVETKLYRKSGMSRIDTRALEKT